MPFEQKICCTIIDCDPRWSIWNLCANDRVYLTPGSPSILIISSCSELISGTTHNIYWCLKISVGIVRCEALKWDPGITIRVRCSRVSNVSLDFIGRYWRCNTSGGKSQTSDTRPRSLQYIEVSVWATNRLTRCIRFSLYYNCK